MTMVLWHNVALLALADRKNAWTRTELLQLRLVCRAAAYVVGAMYRMRVFHYQQPALREMARVRANGLMRLRVWACDRTDRGGNKRYMVGSREAAQVWLTMQPPSLKSLYEILHVRLDFPRAPASLSCCRLYLDCDVQRHHQSAEHNSVADDDLQAMILGRLRSFLKAELKMHKTQIHFHVLQAHSATKFSIHVIGRLFDAARREIFFAGLEDVGALVRRWELFCRKHCRELYRVKDATGTMAHVVDPGVYTTHRAFRVVGASKKGQNRFLRWGEETDVSASRWRALLIQDVDRRVDVPVVRVAEVDGSEPISLAKFWDGSKPKRPVKRLAPVVMASTKPMKLQRTAYGTVQTLMVQFVAEYSGDPGPTVVASARPAQQESPILVILTRSHDCKIARRCHASNHVYFTVDYRNPVYMLQKCHDEECAGKQFWIDLPQWIADVVQRSVQMCDFLQSC